MEKEEGGSKTKEVPNKKEVLSGWWLIRNSIPIGSPALLGFCFWCLLILPNLFIFVDIFDDFLLIDNPKT